MTPFVLVIDDNEGVRTALSMLFSLHDLPCLTAASVEDGIDQLEKATRPLIHGNEAAPDPDEDYDPYAVDEDQLAQANRGSSGRHINFTPLDDALKLYNQCLGELIHIAEAIETLLRLEPLFQDDVARWLETDQGLILYLNLRATKII